MTTKKSRQSIRMENQKNYAEIVSRRFTFAGIPMAGVARKSPAITKAILSNLKVLEAVKKVLHLKQEKVAVAKEYNMTRYQLNKYVAGVWKIKDKEDAQILQEIKRMRTAAKLIFSQEEERNICQIVKILLKESSIKATPWILRKIGYIYATRTFNKCVTNWLTKKLAGMTWYKCFVKRNKAYLPRIMLKSPRHEYLHTEAINDAIEIFEAKKRKKIGFTDKFAVSRTRKTIEKMLVSFSDVQSHSEMAIKNLQKKLASDRRQTPETTMVAVRKLQAECKTQARQLMKIANEDISKIRFDSSTQLFETEIVEDILLQEGKPRSDQLTIVNDGVSDGLNNSPEKSQLTQTNVLIESSANSVTVTNVSSTELSILDTLLDQYEEVLNESDLPNKTSDCASHTALTKLSSNDIATFIDEYEQGKLSANSIVPALTSPELSGSVSTIIVDDDNSDDDEVVFMGTLPMPKNNVDIIKMECEGQFPMPMENEVVKKKLRRAGEEETADIKTVDLVSGSMKFVNVTNGRDNKPDVRFPHVDVTISYANYYLMFHFNKLQSDGQDGSSFDSTYVAHTLKSIFDVSDRVSDIFTLDKIDWKNKKIEFARDLFAVRVNGDTERLNSFEKYVINYITQQKLSK